MTDLLISTLLRHLFENAKWNRRTVTGPPVRRFLSALRLRQSRTGRIVRIAILNLRMDLVVAMQQLATIVDVGQTNRCASTVAGAAEDDASCTTTVVRQIRCRHTIAIVDTVACGDRIPEVQ